VEASPVNPSDLVLNEGHYPARIVLPAVPGIEGLSMVIQLWYFLKIYLIDLM